MASKNEKVTVTLQVTVPTGTSKTKVEKAVSSLLKSGSAPEGFKIGSPKVSNASASSAPATALA